MLILQQYDRSTLCLTRKEKYPAEYEKLGKPFVYWNYFGLNTISYLKILYSNAGYARYNSRDKKKPK
jgi:hypothetical protein